MEQENVPVLNRDLLVVTRTIPRSREDDNPLGGGAKDEVDRREVSRIGGTTPGLLPASKSAQATARHFPKVA
jgi:hypothetical protein